MSDLSNFTHEPDSSLYFWLYLIYGLHGFSALSGLLSPAFIVTTFLTGWPSLIAVVLSYIKRDEAAGTVLASHFEFLIQTFWLTLCFLVFAAILFITLVGIPIAFILMLLVGIWVLCRLLKGLLKLMSARPVY